jgi:hypothetical protein
MTLTNVFRAGCAAAMMLIGTWSAAAPVSVSYSDAVPTPPTSKIFGGGTFSSTATAVLPAPGATGTLVFRGVGDFDDSIGETVDLSLDGILIGTAGQGLPSTTTFTINGVGDAVLEATFTVSAGDLANILASQSVDFQLAFARNVGRVSFFDATLTYNAVPEPMTWVAIAGVAGAMVLRRRRLNSAMAA